MPNQHGGYRAPAGPAPVSGPGSLARRTDGGPGQPIRRLPNAGYGESQAFEELQRAAPLASAASGGGGQPVPIDRSGIVPLGAPSGRPNEPVTAGAAAGAGPGPEVLGSQNAYQDDLMQLNAYMPALRFFASLPGASAGFRRYVRQLEGATV